MKNSAKSIENFDESLKHKSFKKFRSVQRSRTKRLGKTNFWGIDNREMVSQTDSNSKVKSRPIRMKTSQESIKKNNSKRAAISLQGVTGFDTRGIPGISKGMQHQEAISSHSVIITLTVVIPVSIAIFFMVRSYNKRRKKKRKKKAEKRNFRYKLLGDSGEKLHQSCSSISSGEAEAASAVDFINMMESKSLTEMASFENYTEKYLILSDSDGLQKKIKEITKEKDDLSLNLPPINLLCYNGFFPSNSDLQLMASLTKVCSGTFKSDYRLYNDLKGNSNFKTTDSKESANSLCDRDSLSLNLSNVSNSDIFCSQICLKIQDKSVLKKDTPELEMKKSSIKNNSSKIKEPSDIRGENINLRLKNGDEVPVVDSRMSFTTACTTLEESKRGIITEIKSSNRCPQSLKANQDDVANPEVCTNEVNWTPKTPLESKIRDQLKCKSKQGGQVASEYKRQNCNLGFSDNLRQSSPLQIEISCLAHKNEHDSNTPKSMKSYSSKPKSNLQCNTESPTSKEMPKSVCTQTSDVNLQTVDPIHNRNCKTSNAQKIYKVEYVKFLNNQNHSNGKSKLKSISKQYTVTSSKSVIENHISTRKSLELVRKNLNAISKRGKRQKIRRHKINHQQPNSSISKSKSDIHDKIPCNQNEYQSKFGRNTQNETALAKINFAKSIVVQPEKVPTNSEESSNNERLSSSSKLACGRTPCNTEHSGLSLDLDYPPVHNNSLKQRKEFEKNQCITKGSTTSYFKCGKTPRNTESESNKSYLSQGSESSKFNCGKAPINTENESGESNSFLSTIKTEFNSRKPSNTEKCLKGNSADLKEASQAIDDRLRKQPTRKGSLETTLECTCIRRSQVEGDYEYFCETYTNPNFWNRPDHSPKFLLGTSVTSSCSVTSSAPDTCLQEFITNDAIHDLRISPKQHTHLSTTGSRRCKKQLNNTEQSSKLENTTNKNLNTQISLEEGFSTKNTPSELLKQVIHRLEDNVTGGLLSLKPTTPKTVRFSYDKDTCSLSSGTINASNSTDMAPRPLEYLEQNTKDDDVYYSYDSPGSIIPEFKVYKKIQR